ncbi:MAG: phosphonate C-P lyase system protein PhnG [Sediminimonas qiaohouensis]|uniref:Phosphonate C-P lyase system protein PhnG n=1 Tax=Sediminimonas qiaohouensis TaxID=552061 RepID=A0A7C9LBG0_9RHOB|nr:phosphonate C-P lyase system protein PhnG [Sediminimonas qiaohouensis]MTJ05137.1 phosphonate C-P lyase system protein PhnG [Sediminimonas qiaohouensis]
MSEARKTWMSLLAKAPPKALGQLWDDTGLAPDFTWLRAPEIGSTMVQGRMGGTGAPFNLGEMTVTRCALRLTDGGTVGHSYVQGRDKTHARIAALIDALMQTALADRLQAEVLDPLATAMDERRRAHAAKAAATKVDFFTMVRGED